MSHPDEPMFDVPRMFVDADGALCFGNHRGETLDELVENFKGAGYLRWMLDELNLSDAEREDIEQALEGAGRRPKLSLVKSRVQPVPVKPGEVRESGASMRVGDTVEMIQPLGPRFRIGVRAVVSSRNAAGDFALRADNGATAAFAYDKAARVVVVQRAAKEAPPPRQHIDTKAKPPQAPKPIVVDAEVVEELAPLDDIEELAPLEELSTHPVDQLAARRVALIPAPTGDAVAPAWTWTSDQANALAHIERWANGDGPRMITLSGYAGTGKSTLMAEAVKKMPGPHLSAMTGKAAMRLRDVTNRATSTLHAVLYKPPEEQHGDAMAGLSFTERREPTMATLVVDEASLITPQILVDLQEWAAEGVRILLVGDSMQLPPILTKEDEEIHGSDFTVFEKIGGPKLSTVMRAQGGVLAAATYIREKQKVLMESNKDYSFWRSPDTVTAAVNDYLADPDDHVLITWRNELRLQANNKIRAKLGRNTKLPARGEPVMIRQNQGAYLNGEIVIADSWWDGPVIGGDYDDKEGLQTTWLRTAEGDEILTLPQGNKVFFDGGRPYINDWYAWRKFCNDVDSRPSDAHGAPCPIPVPVTWGYCVTAHAAQGSEWRRATVFLGQGDSRISHFVKPTKLPNGDTVAFSVRFLYTCLTRAKSKATLYVSSR